MKENLISKAIDTVGLCKLGKVCGVTYQAVKKWEAKGRLPRSEWTGETDYAFRIEQATNGVVTRAQLLNLENNQSDHSKKPHLATSVSE